VKVSARERDAGAIELESLLEATRRLRTAGYVVLEDVLEGGLVEALASGAARRLSPKRRPSGQVNIWAPRERPFNDTAVVANPVVTQVLRNVLGERILRAEYWIKARLPGEGYEQYIHRDRKHLYPELGLALPPWAIAASFALTDFREETGATEVWPGSHGIVGDELHLTEAQAAQVHSERILMRPGSVALRDLRLWHRGMPNRSDELRMMLDVVYHRDFGVLNRAGEPVLTLEEYLERRRVRAKRVRGKRAGGRPTEPCD
jgi:ectoine hydroxylase-related dioxygenase (phytanoyl-CoA dioxygenase family)